jgi:hypothetical protein
VEEGRALGDLLEQFAIGVGEAQHLQLWQLFVVVDVEACVGEVEISFHKRTPVCRCARVLRGCTSDTERTERPDTDVLVSERNLNRAHRNMTASTPSARTQANHGHAHDVRTCRGEAGKES